MDEIKTSCNEIVQRRIIFMFKETDKTYLFKLIYYSRIVWTKYFENNYSNSIIY